MVPPPGTPVGALIASGEIELGFQQLSELMNVPGVEVVGLMPAGAQFITTFSAGLGKGNAGIELYVENAFDKRAVQLFTTECAISVCGGSPYWYPNRPRTIGIKYTQKF